MHDLVYDLDIWNKGTWKKCLDNSYGKKAMIYKPLLLCINHTLIIQ